ncbi:MAG: winged helix-turn-helix domain-containing protein [Methanocella sp.]
MPELTLTQEQARRFLLAHQGLWPPRRLQGKSALLEYVRRVGCIQFDPLNVVGHNPELVLQARVRGFCPALLKELLYADRTLIDGWDKQMSIYLTTDWPHFRRDREAARRKLGDPSQPVAAVLPEVRETIRQQGPLSALELAYDQSVDWPWAPTRLARAALESMYFWGELVVHHKVNTRKVYDLAVRHLPEELLSAPDPHATEEEYQDWRVLRRLGGVGLLWERSGDAWLGIAGLRGKQRRASLARLLDRGEVSRVRVEGLEHPLYLRSVDRSSLETALAATATPAGAAILAPLDNLLWDRQLIEALFGFAYRWEVYKPAAARRYGYYVLPVLCGDRFVARFEPGREKPGRTLVVKNWWWEPGVTPAARLRSELRSCFADFLAYLGASSVRVDDRLKNETNLAWLSPLE